MNLHIPSAPYIAAPRAAQALATEVFLVEKLNALNMLSVIIRIFNLLPYLTKSLLNVLGTRERRIFVEAQGYE